MKYLLLDPCEEALEWLASLPDGTTDAEAWQRCPRPDWLLWVAARTGVPEATLVRLAIRFARTVLHLVPDGEERPRLAVEAAERWCGEQSDAARDAACDAACDAARAARATYAADAAAFAADAATYAAYAAYSVDAAAAAAYAAAAAAAAYAAAAFAEANSAQCELIREVIRFDDLVFPYPLEDGRR